MKTLLLITAIALALAAGQALADDAQKSLIVHIDGWEKAASDSNWLRLKGITPARDFSIYGLRSPINVRVSLGENRQWLFNAGVWYQDSGSRMKMRLHNSGLPKIESKSEPDPWVYSVGIGYRF